MMSIFFLDEEKIARRCKVCDENIDPIYFFFIYLLQKLSIFLTFPHILLS